MTEALHLPPLPPCAADMMLGRLATWLRLLGADVSYQSWISDADLMERARNENRLVLTRDRGLLGLPGSTPRFGVTFDRLPDQLAQVAAHFDLTALVPFSRCVRCNVPVKVVPKESAKGRVWEYVYDTQEIFTECPLCGRLFWKGTHPARAREDLRRMLGEDLARRIRWGEPDDGFSQAPHRKA